MMIDGWEATNMMKRLDKQKSMANIQIGIQNNYGENYIITENNGVVIIGNEVTINGVKMPPLPAKGHNSTIINNKVYMNGYEIINGKWKKTLRALWYKYC